MTSAMTTVPRSEIVSLHVLCYCNVPVITERSSFVLNSGILNRVIYYTPVYNDKRSSTNHYYESFQSLPFICLVPNF